MAHLFVNRRKLNRVRYVAIGTYIRRSLYTDHGSRHNKRANQTNEEEICSLRRRPPLILYRQLSSHAYDVAVLQISVCGFFLRLIYH